MFRPILDHLQVPDADLIQVETYSSKKSIKRDIVVFGQIMSTILIFLWVLPNKRRIILLVKVSLQTDLHAAKKREYRNIT
jgi:hypothetical protein